MLVLIDFDFVPSDQPFWKEGLIHKIHNFGEDLFHEFSKNGLAVIDIHAVDRATDRISVTVPRRRYTTRAIAVIRTVLARHYLADIARISELDSTTD